MSRVEESQKKFYGAKFRYFGDDPKSLSWNDQKSQHLRFEKITELFKYENSAHFSVHEVGCGLAHFKAFLDSGKWNAEYSGSDIVEDFISINRKKYPDTLFCVESISNDHANIDDQIKGYDYYCLNGTFHTKEDNATELWEEFIFKSMINMFRFAKKGICINFLTAYSDYYDESLYYAEPRFILNWVVENCSRFVSLDHDIPLYEFFVYIYKEDFIKTIYPQYSRYFSVK